MGSLVDGFPRGTTELRFEGSIGLHWHHERHGAAGLEIKFLILRPGLKWNSSLRLGWGLKIPFLWVLAGRDLSLSFVVGRGFRNLSLVLRCE